MNFVRGILIRSIDPNSLQYPLVVYLCSSLLQLAFEPRDLLLLQSEQVKKWSWLKNIHHFE